MLKENVLYSYLQVIDYLRRSRKSEIRLYINIPGRKKLRCLMFDDGEKFYTINETEHTVYQKNKPLTKCIFNEGSILPIIRVINDDYLNP